LFLWGPERPERFPWATALGRLGLSIDESIELLPTTVKLVLPKEKRFRVVAKHGVALKPADIVRVLGPVSFDDPVEEAAPRGHTRRRYRPTASLTIWSLAAKLALELVARQSFIPSIQRASRGRLRAVWLAAVEASHDVGRVRRLATDMPGSAHALLQPASRRRWDRRGRGRRRRRAPRVWHPELVVKVFLDAAVDSLVRSTTRQAWFDMDALLVPLKELEVAESTYDLERAALLQAQLELRALEAVAPLVVDAIPAPVVECDEDEEGDEEDHDEEERDEEERDDEEEEEEEDSEDLEGRNGNGDGRMWRDGIALSELPMRDLGRWEHRWLKALLGPAEDSFLEYHHDDPPLLDQFGEWLSWVLGKSEEAAKEVDSKTGLWLEMPDDSAGDEAFWYLRYMLVAVDDPSLAVPARQVFNVGSSRLRILDHSFDRPHEKMLADLGQAGRLFEPIKESLEQSRPEGVFLDARQAWKFISEAGPVLYATGYDVRLPEELTGQGQRRLRARLRIRDLKPGEFGTDQSHVSLNDLAAFQWEAALGDEVISAEEFRQISDLKQPLVRWRGTWVLVDPLQLKGIEDLLADARAAGTMSRFEALSRALTGVADPSAPNKQIEVVIEGRIAELVEQMSSDELVEERIQVPDTFRGELRPYQERGLAWLVYQSRLGLGCCLADDMGLGKTIQLIAELLYHQELAPDDNRGTLLFCPTSVVGNWQREIEKFGPSLHVVKHHGIDRANTLEALNAQMRIPHTVMLTTYGLATRDVDLLKKRKWARFVLDEAQAIKNVTAKRSQAVREIDAEFRVALTGTPIENRLSELWSILDFLNPGLLGTFEKFRRSYAMPIERYHDDEVLDRLRRLVGPFIMRRVKSDPNIIQDLPEKFEAKVYCTLTREQATLYQALVDSAMGEIEDAKGIARHGRVLALLTRLKQVVDHPILYLKDEEQKTRSGKLTRLLEMLEEIIDNGDRALIFSQFKQMGDILVKVLSVHFDTDVPFLHGGVPQSQRDELVDRFQDEDGPPIFVLSLKAGGTGLNLTAANHVFHYDRWWNPAVEDQATDRAFRIGQMRNVQVHKLISLGTLEEKIDVMLTEKRSLADTIVDSTGAWVTDLDTEALRELVSLGSDSTIDDAD